MVTGGCAQLQLATTMEPTKFLKLGKRNAGFKCADCDAANPYSCERHLAGHLGVPFNKLQYRCRVCGFGILYKDRVGRHLAVVHGVADDQIDKEIEDAVKAYRKKLTEKDDIQSG